jgi:hypothetical protein
LKTKRSLEIQEILTFLENEKKTNPTQAYSINENVRFFRNANNFITFLKWYKNFLKHIDSSKIIELTDFENENFTRNLHHQMIKIERRKIPGLITPLVTAVSKCIISLHKPVLVADFGSGSMELTRQIIKRLMKHSFQSRLTIVAFDKSQASHDIGVINFSAFKEHLGIYETDSFNSTVLEQIQKKSRKNINLILSKEDIFDLSREKAKIKFDIAYHSFFKHHLDETQKKKIDSIFADISDQIFEYDDFFSLFGLLFEAIYTWKNPIVLNGAVFSILRSPTLQIIKQYSGSVKIFKRGNILSWRGTYLRKF